MASLTQKEKARFRSSKEWKEFRIRKIEENDYKCECCELNHKKNKSRLTVHHRDLDKNNYKDLSDGSKFSVLCVSCHKMLHQLERRVSNKKQPSMNPKVIDLVQPFFIHLSHKAGDRAICPSCGGAGSLMPNR